MARLAAHATQGQSAKQFDGRSEASSDGGGREHMKADFNA